MSNSSVPEIKSCFADKLSPWKIGILFFILLVCVNLQQMYNPPYWDDIIGLHNQAIFIAKHNFNPNVWRVDVERMKPGPYLSLAVHSMVYPYSIVPWIHAIFYRTLSPLDAHLAGHIFNILCLSIAAALAYAIIRQRRGSPIFALVFTGLAFFDPILAGQTASLGQECPMALLSMLAVYLLSRQKYNWALAMALFAMLVRPTGLILVIAIFCLFVYNFIRNWHSYSSRKRTLSILLCSLALMIGGMLVFYHSNLLKMDIEPDMFLHVLYLRCSAYLLYFCLEVFVATLSTIWLLRHASWRSLDDASQFRLILLMFLWGLLIAMNLFGVSLPRYVTFSILPAFILIADAAPLKARYFAPMALMAAVLFYFHPMKQLPELLLRSGEYLERSREYLTDLRANQMACKVIATQIPPETPVLVKWPFGQMLTMPEFGYVDKPLPNIYLASTLRPSYAPVKQIRPNDPIPDNAACLFTSSSLSYEFPRYFPPSPSAPIIWRDQSLPGWCLLFYRKR